MRRFVIWLIGIAVISAGVGAEAAVADGSMPELTTSVLPGDESISSPSSLPESGLFPRNYLFIHDTSTNMRKRRRILTMQTSIRTILDQVSEVSYAGLRAFGHRFPVNGPDVCDDTDIVVPIGRILNNQEDFEEQLNMLSDPIIGGGAPVGLALQQGLADLEHIQGPKEIYLYLVDLMKCRDTNAIEVIRSACQVEDLHLTLVGFGLRADQQILQQNKIPRLGCVDVLNLMTQEEADMLPDQLLTRIAVEFRNTDGELVDPASGENISVQLSQRDEEGNIQSIRHKLKEPYMKSSSVETVGLKEGAYLLDVAYQEQKLREQHALFVRSRYEAREVIRLGRMMVDVTDSDGVLIENPEARQLRIVVNDAGKTIRTADHATYAEFDLLPGRKYTVQVSYAVGGEVQQAEYQEEVTIEEGNHKKVSIALPIGAVSGKVTDMAGAPAENVEVNLRERSVAEGATPQEFTIVTDSNGTYFFPDIPTGEYDVQLNKAGYKLEETNVSVIGGKINTIADIRLFHGFEVLVAGVSGTEVTDAKVTIVSQATSAQIPVSLHKNLFRNTEHLPEGEYLISVEKDGYRSDSKVVAIQDTDSSLEVPFHLPYRITVQGTVVNGKGDPLPEAVIEFHQHSSAYCRLPTADCRLPTADSEELPQTLTQADGRFTGTLFVTDVGNESITIRWQDIYNQEYTKEIEFPLPPIPQTVKLGEIRLPINFLRLSFSDVLGDGLTADSILLSHQQTGQSGIPMTPVEHGIYESPALPDGEYLLQIFKQGYQDIDHRLSIAGGVQRELPFTLYNYVAVSGTVVNGKQERVAGATLTFGQEHCELATSQPVVTGKDGRFRTTLLVKTPNTEHVTVRWISPETGEHYQFETEFVLPGIPIAEFYPMNVGEYQLPVNFLSVSVEDIAEKGLREAQVTFTSEQGEKIAGFERGGGIYESPDLPDGHYDVSISKKGYKENILIPDVVVGENSRKVRVGPVTIPHYVTVTGTILNGKDEGAANVEILFGGKHSEQLEKCRTDQQGRFTTTLLVTGAAEETWKAVWKRQEYSISGSFPLPVHPDAPVNIGDMYLPINFISLPIEDVQGNPLKNVDVDITYIDGTAIRLEEFSLEEIEPGVYQAQYLPDGIYTFSLQKEGYELGRHFDVTIEGGKHDVLEPLILGHYVTVKGLVVNGKLEPVAGARVNFQQLASTLILPELEEQPQEPGETAETEEESVPELQAPSVDPSLLTDTEGMFTAKLLVHTPGIEQVTVIYGENKSASFPLELLPSPGTQPNTLHLPINFVQVEVTDVSGQSLPDAVVTLTHQAEKTIFPAKEKEQGFYETQGIPDGTYVIAVNKERYDQQTDTITVQKGEVKQRAYRLKHYVTVRGHVINGKGEDVAAAIVSFEYLKSSLNDKIVSGPDGAFEANLLVKETGRETGEITWIGQHGTYSRQFWVEFPSSPTVLTLSEQETLLPINFISLEVKSVAATGVPGATVTLTHRDTNQVIEARDLENGNYEGQELPNGTYDISISKDRYKPIAIEHIAVENGEHKSDLLIPKFLHYITINGMVVNGKHEGVPEARVLVKDPKRVRECKAVSTRQDGSFTMHALVTDAGNETLDIIWKEIYARSVSIPLPSTPEHVQLEDIKLPINFIILNVQSIFGESLSGVSVNFLKKDRWHNVVSPQERDYYQGETFVGKEVSNGRYESPEMPDGEYIVIARKKGYSQDSYRTIPVQAGETVSDVTLPLPHVVTVEGTVTDGKNQGIAEAEVRFKGQVSQRIANRSFTDETGYFTEQLQITGTGKEQVTIVVNSPPYTRSADEQFVLTQEFEFMKKPGEQELDNLRLPINYIPIRVQDVSGQALTDADVKLTWLSPLEAEGSTALRGGEHSAEGNRQPASASLAMRSLPTRPARNLGDGNYEGTYLKDGVYKITVFKEGYEQQERQVSVGYGEVAQEAMFILPHYVTVSGTVMDGKTDGVPDAILEFDPQNSTLIQNPESKIRNPKSEIHTDSKGHFSARILVKKAGIQRVRVVWHEWYVRQLSFQLPDQPVHYTLEDNIRLPINYVPVRITNVLGEGLAGVDVTLKKAGSTSEERIHFHSLGDGVYEARQLPDGVYAMALYKEGYQDATETISVSGGEQAPGQHFSLPHFVTVRGKVVNSKGYGVEGATVTLSGFSSQLLEPDTTITTGSDGSFQMELLVTGGGSRQSAEGSTALRGGEQPELQEHIEITWTAQSLPFGIAHDFALPPVPGSQNLGVLTLPANFAPVSVQDVAGQGLSGVKVVFIDENGKEFLAEELNSGFYEGQNLPDGIYTVSISKQGYQQAQKTDVQIGGNPQQSLFASSGKSGLTFRLPYYVTLQGIAVDGKGQTLATDIALTLEGAHSRLLPETVHLNQDGTFKATLMVDTPGRDQLRITYNGEHGLHARQVAVVLPPEPATIDLHRVSLPINYIPIEVKDLMGYGVAKATVFLHDMETEKKIAAKDLGNGFYEGAYLPDGTYKISVTKEGYKSEESTVFTVSEGIVSETKSFTLQHYVWITGFAMNGEGDGVRDPVITVERLRSVETQKFSDSNGKFEVELEVRQVGNEKLYIEWKNLYRTPVVFKLPRMPERKNLGDIQLPINFLSILVTDISGSTLRDADVTVENALEVVQSLKTDQNGYCKTYDLQDGLYTVSVEKTGYKLERREVYVSDGNVIPVRFTLPHYVVIRGTVKDIMEKPVGEVTVIFEEFTDMEGQKLRTLTDPSTGEFEQKLLIDDPKFLERQRGHFRLKKGAVDQLFTFKIPTEPDQVSHYRTLLFPANYLLGKVVDAEVKTVPVHGANVSLVLISEPVVVTGKTQAEQAEQAEPLANAQKIHRFTTDELGVFHAGNLREGEYKVTIQKEGFVLHEDFVRISGLLQEKEFSLQKEIK